MASRASANSNGYKVIPQGLMSSTLSVGFMGLVVAKPHYLGVSCDNRADREGFIHFWAVISSMMGIKDEFNINLFSLDVVEM